MKIAFSSEEKNGLESRMSHHFGRCPYYTIVTLDDDNNTVIETADIENPYFQSHGPGQVPQFIANQNIDVMIAGGMGQKAVDFFNQFKIKVATGASGTVKESLNNFLSGHLSGYSPCTENKNCH